MRDVFLAASATSVAIGALYIWGKARRAWFTGIQDVVSVATVQPNSPSYFGRNSSAEIAKRTITLTTVAFLLSWLVGPPRLSGPSVWRSTAHMSAIIGILWVGPILEAPISVRDTFIRRIREIVHLPLSAVRELIVAPVAEELIFRHVLITLLAKRSLWPRIGISAALFSLAHLHLIVNNAVEFCRGELEGIEHHDGAVGLMHLLANQRERDDLAARSWADARRHTRGQLTVVFLYGLVCGWVYERCCHRSVVAAVVGHSLCNFAGVPAFSFLCSRDDEGRRMSWVRRFFSGVAYTSGVIGAIVLALQDTQAP
jgi:membrane protease YdiL (CAAX protease family)